jgi:hypothetical protein
MAAKPVELADATSARTAVHYARTNEKRSRATVSAGDANNADAFLNVLPIAAAEPNAVSEMQAIEFGAQAVEAVHVERSTAFRLAAPRVRRGLQRLGGRCCGFDRACRTAAPDVLQSYGRRCGACAAPQPPLMGVQVRRGTTKDSKRAAAARSVIGAHSNFDERALFAVGVFPFDDN